MSVNEAQAAYALVAQLSQRVGRMVPTWCQGAGGNISAKFSRHGDQRLVIKASGLRLDQVRADAGLVEISHRTFTQACSAAFLTGAAGSRPLTASDEELYAQLLQQAKGGEARSLRPSMETGFHAVLSAKVVVHLHSLAALLMAHEQKDDHAVTCWLTEKLRGKVVILPPVQPGLALLRAVAEHRDAAAVVLTNHGVILAMETAAALEDWARVEVEFCERLGYRSLLRALTAQAEPKEALQEVLGPAPMRYYFPDTAVFAPRLKASLREVKRTLPQKNQGGAGEALYICQTQDQDMAEIWQAQQLLYAECPNLEELPLALSGSVASLPTEQFRLSKSAG